eukprot:TRINITY_DN18891_c0_g1_i1.p3 TRINITY_DN18891_c0_g1~~TRINITY_DN18891_c0_g1_i1.p3  ORF type:complete len:122 (+),score=33.47 TRINITY_DN18891_c0_g1_i1:150-515(+)
MEDPRSTVLNILLHLFAYDAVNVYYLDFNSIVLLIRCMQLILLYRITKPRHASMAPFVFGGLVAMDLLVLLLHSRSWRGQPIMVVMVGAQQPASVWTVLAHDAWMVLLQTVIALNRRYLLT